MKETYTCGDCGMMGLPVMENQVQKPLPNNHQYMMRTNFDKQMLNKYNKLSLAYDTNLMKLQFN
jgi:hypothetical protein